MSGSPPICITTEGGSSSNIFFPCGGGGGHIPPPPQPDALSTSAVAVVDGSSMQLYSEMEALQLSRSDNPFVRQSQDNLDAISLAREEEEDICNLGPARQQAALLVLERSIS